MQEISSKHKNSVYVENVNALDVKIRLHNLRLIYRTTHLVRPFSALLHVHTPRMWISASNVSFSTPNRSRTDKYFASQATQHDTYNNIISLYYKYCALLFFLSIHALAFLLPCSTHFFKLKQSIVPVTIYKNIQVSLIYKIFQIYVINFY